MPLIVPMKLQVGGYGFGNFSPALEEIVLGIDDKKLVVTVHRSPHDIRRRGRSVGGRDIPRRFQNSPSAAQALNGSHDLVVALAGRNEVVHHEQILLHRSLSKVVNFPIFTLAEAAGGVEPPANIFPLPAPRFALPNCFR